MAILPSTATAIMPSTVPRRRPKHTPVLVQASMERLGERLRRARKVRHVTAEQLCQASDISLSTLRALEAGSDGVSMGNFLKVMKGLNLLAQIEGLLDPKADPETIAYVDRKLGEAR